MLVTLSSSQKRAFGGGIAGASAMVVQVFSQMWMRTMMNYQYRYGKGIQETAKILYKEGGIPRFYRGIGPALLQGPQSRFGDTAANTGALAFFDSNEYTRNLPIPIKTIGASMAAASFRIFLMPIDTCKTILQVEGSHGLQHLRTKIRMHGPVVLYHSSIAASAATFVGHYPWFMSYNYLNSTIPQYHDNRLKKLARNAAIGFTCSCIADTVANSLRVVKTYRQTHQDKVSYINSVKNVVKSDGIAGLFGRGLKTRLIANGFQGLLFSVLWKYFDEQYTSRAK